MPVVSDINADKYQSAGRHQTIRRQTSENSILERKRVQAPLVPGFKPPSGCALGYGQAVRCSLNGQAMLAYEPDLRFLCRNRTSSARRAGWFKGEYVRLSRLTCPVGSSARNALAHPCLRGGQGRSEPEGVKEALIHSQNRISYEFLSNASS